MPRCQAVNYIGVACNLKADYLNYFWFHDPLGRISEMYNICQKHSNLLVDQLMEKENAYANLIKACFNQIDKKRNELYGGASVSEQRNAIREAKVNGLPEPKFASIQSLKNDISSLYTKVNNCKQILVIERNRVCRYCKFPLKEPETPKDQVGKKYTPIDFKSPVGYRRLDFQFSICFYI